VIPELGLRARLTILVTAVFAIAMTITSLLVLRAVENDLVDSARANAETVLTDYLEGIYGGTATLGVIDPANSTRFFYRDSEGNELTEQEYFEALSPELSGFDLFPIDEGQGEPPHDFEAARLDFDPVTGELFDSTGSIVTFEAEPLPVGKPRSVSVGDGLVAVAQTVTFSEGASFDVGVSSPLRPVTDSLDALAKVLWIAVFILVGAVAAITWLAATRALRPVHAISSQARAITASKISQRLPVPDANDEIRELALTVNDMLARLEESQQRQHQLVSDASHELRNPVAASLAQLEVSTANPDATNWPVVAATVLAEQKHLGRLIDDLLALSRIEESQIGAVDVDLDDLISTEAKRPHPAPVRTSIPVPVRVIGDPSLLTRAIRNLVDNATRHAKSEVLVSLTSDAGFGIIYVDDDGPGIPGHQRQRIFDRFARVDEARDRNRGGAGLGLAIAQEVAQAHRGSITVETSPLGGARFTVVLPLHPGAEPSD